MFNLGKNKETHNERFRYGDAAWETDKKKMKKAGLYTPKGLRVGFDGNTPLYVDSNAPHLIIGSPGSGKLSTLLGYNLIEYWHSALIIDPKGELYSMSAGNLVNLGQKKGYAWDPFGVLDGIAPAKRCNPLKILYDSPNRYADAQAIFENLIPIPPDIKEPFWPLRGRSMLIALAVGLYEIYGETSLPMLYEIVLMAFSQRDQFITILERMLQSETPEVASKAGELLMKLDEGKEAGFYLAEMDKALNWMVSPKIRYFLSDPGDSSDTFDLLELCKSRVNIHLIIPSSYLISLAPVLRLFLKVGMMLKERNHGSQVLFLAEEAGQLGAFTDLTSAFTIGRGYGAKIVAVFQSMSQIEQNMGLKSLSTYLTSAQVKNFIGISDPQSARIVSELCGDTTLTFDDNLAQEAAREQKRQAIYDMLTRGDIFDTAFRAAHNKKQSQHRSKQRRRLITEGEVITMPTAKQIVHIDQKDINPLYCDRYPYWTKMPAGSYFPNHLHEKDTITTIDWLGRLTTRRVITEPVPDSIAHLPQYSHGKWQFIQGKRPNV